MLLVIIVGVTAVVAPSEVVVVADVVTAATTAVFRLLPGKESVVFALIGRIAVPVGGRGKVTGRVCPTPVAIFAIANPVALRPSPSFLPAAAPTAASPRGALRIPPIPEGGAGGDAGRRGC